MKKQNYNQIFESFSHKKILIIGDVMIDAYYWGKVERISPEAPVQILDTQNTENRLGGAANVARNVKALGATPILASVIGDDEKANILLQILQQRQMPQMGLLKSTNRPTTVKTRLIADGQHLLRVDEETTQPICPETELNFIQLIFNIIGKEKVDAIIFEDYDKGVITENLITAVVDMANDKKIPTLVDPKKRNFLFYKGVTLFKPNFKELTEGLKLEFAKTNFEALEAACQKMRTEHGQNMIMTTLSEQGIAIAGDGFFYRLPAEIRDIADVSGAGDTVISTAALCLAAGMQPNEIARISNIAGGLVCEKVGVVPIDKKQLLVEITLS